MDSSLLGVPKHVNGKVVELFHLGHLAERNWESRF